MSAFDSSSYSPPGVYTQVVLNANTAVLSGTARIPVFIGEGTQFFTRSNEEIHRGSSATSDDQIVGENLSAQVTGTTRTFQLTHFPVVTGDGTGTVTNDVTKVNIQVADIPATIVSLVGATGVVTLQSIAPAGSNVTANYYFKRTDTLISNEDISYQIPTFASLLVQTTLALSLSIPGAGGNQVTFAMTLAASGHDLGVPDIAAVTGAGTNTISIELRDTDDSVRTLQGVANLISAGIPTLSSGYLTVASLTGGSTPGAAFAATHFTSGTGQNTNTTFKVAHVPIVDGTNGGVVTTDPSKVTLVVAGVPVPVTAVNGSTGLITSSSPINPGSSAQVTYYTNTYQDTSDILPDANVASITQVGYGPNRSDFVQGVDYVLTGNTISWGAATTTAAGTATAGYTPFDGNSINTTLVDEQVFLVPVQGATNGVNSVFTLNDTPVDGSGLGRATDVPTLVSVYVGATPVAALTAGAVRVSRLSGASAQVTLFNPPATGSNVYASYWRSTLNDHTFTLTVEEANIPGEGTFTAKDELNRPAPNTSVGTTTVSNENFADTGIVWPSNSSDLVAPLGAADEVVTLTFQNDDLTTITTPAVQANLTLEDSGSVARIKLTATTPGTAGNTVTVALLGGGAGAADAAAITGAGTNALSVNIVMSDNSTTRSWAQIVALFSTYPAAATTIAGGVILASGVTGADLTGQAVASAATHLANGAAAVSTPYANRFLVTSSRTLSQAQADGLGRTGNATTGTSDVGRAGYLGQTYIDTNTAVKFTVVDPAKALSYGYVQLPSPQYIFTPGDVLTFVISSETGHLVGSTTTRALPGLRTQVVTTLGMNPGDTAIVTTFNRAGTEPAVGDYYYVSYTVAKAATDYALQTFTTLTDAYAVYGQPSVQNRLSLALYLFGLNGGTQFAAVQVPAQAGLTQASDQSFIDAIQSLSSFLPGTNTHANIITPLSTSSTVQQALGLFLSQQAAPRKKAEAIGIIGFDQYSTPATAQATAQALANERIIAVAPFVAGIQLQTNNYTPAVEYAVSGEFIAAALTGLAVNPSVDVATTLTGKSVVGFTRLLQTYDGPTNDLMAAAGLTVVTDNQGALEIRHYKTTNPANVLTSEPYVTTISDQISQDFRSLFKQFIGLKEATGAASSIQAVANAYLKGKNNVLITAYQPTVVTPDANDPTTFNVSVSYVPMFSTLYINVTFTVNIS